jgi:AraC-like DNA-binding protein
MDIQFTLSLEDGHILEFFPGLPAAYKGPVLKGATCCSTHSPLAEITLQRLFGEGYSISLFLGNLLKRIPATGWIHAEGMYNISMLKNSNRKKLKGQSKIHIREDQYVSFYTQPTACTTSFEKNKEFRMLVLFYSPQLLQGLIPYFPELKTIIGSDPAKMITRKPFWIPFTLKEIINQVFNCQYNESSRQFYFDLKVREMLYQILETSFNKKDKDLYFTPWEVSRIHEAKKILIEHIAKKPPSIRKLSKLVALNEYKLKKGFHQYFNNSIAQWMHEQKMQYSRELILNTNRPIKEICTLVGYPLTTNFITAFRKHFGVTPGELRRN